MVVVYFPLNKKAKAGTSPVFAENLLHSSVDITSQNSFSQLAVGCRQPDGRSKHR
jgi:hypothetical protein